MMTIARRTKKAWVLFLLMTMTACPSVLRASFEDEVDIQGEEVFSAANQVVQKEMGVYKANQKKGQIESRWKEDIVKRSRGMFKNILKQSVYRRYRLKVDIHPTDKGTQLKIKGTFQERSTSSDANRPWETVKMMAADHRLERELFFRILTQIEDNRKAASTAPPIPVTPLGSPLPVQS